MSIRARLGEFKALRLDPRTRELLARVKVEALRLLTVGGALRADAIAGNFVGFFVRFLETEFAAADELHPWRLTKPYDEILIAEDELVSYTLTKVLNDVVTINDSFGRTGFYSETAGDMAATTDQLALRFTRALSDTATAGDGLTTIRFLKALAEEVSASETVTLALTKVLADAATASDTLVRLAKHVPPADAVTGTEAGWLVNFNYGDITYFAEHYVGQYETF